MRPAAERASNKAGPEGGRGASTRKRARDESMPAGATFCPTCATGAGCPRCKNKPTRRLSSPDDASERFAEQVAETVTGSAIKDDHDRRYGEPADVGSASSLGPAIPAAVDTQISAERGRGVVLPETVRGSLEARLGSLDEVRIHVDERATRLADAIGASAFTVGRDIFFARGAYRPDTTAGQRLLAHELAHTVHHGHDTSRVHRQPKRTPCQGTSDLPGNPDWLGTYEHVLIQQHYISKINPNAEAEYVIPESGPNGGDAPADLVDPTTGIIFEIKFIGKKADADAKVLRSIEKASEHCGEHIPWHAGQYFPRVELPHHDPDMVLVAKRGKPGVIVYWLERRKRQEEEQQESDRPPLFADRLAAQKHDDIQPEDEDRDDDDDTPQPPPPVIFDKQTAENLAKTTAVTTGLAMIAQTVVETGRALAMMSTAAPSAAAAGGGGGTAALGGGAIGTGTSVVTTGARASRILAMGGRAGIIGAAIAITYLGADTLARYTYGTIYQNTRGARLQDAFRRLGLIAERLALVSDAAQSTQDQLLLVGEDEDVDADASADFREYYLEVLYKYRLTLAEMITEMQDCGREFSAIEDELAIGIELALEQSIEAADLILASGDRTFFTLVFMHSELDKVMSWVEVRLGRLIDNHVRVFNRDAENWLEYKR